MSTPPDGASRTVEQRLDVVLHAVRPVEPAARALHTDSPAARSGERVGRTRMSRAAREQQLLDVAEVLFVERGYADTSIEDIARTAGVTRPVVYGHYGSKDGVYLACVRRARRQFEQGLAELPPAGPDPQAVVRQGADAYFRLLEEDPRRWELLFARTGLVSDTLAAGLTEERFRTVSLIAARYRAYAPEVDPMVAEAMAHAVSGCAEQLGRWWLRHADLGREVVVDLHMRFIWPAMQAELSD